MQFKGYHINNLKSYRKYFCFSDAAEALENGAYQEWLTGISETLRQEESRAGEDEQVIREIRMLLDRISGYRSRERQSAGGQYEDCYRRLFLLFYRLAGIPVSDQERKEIDRQARHEAGKRTGRQKDGGRKQDTCAEIAVTAERYEMKVWNSRFEELSQKNHLLFRWKKLINRGTVPALILPVEDGCAVFSRCLNPGGYVWALTLDGCFVKWGRRVQVHRRAYACVDRKGCLTVNGYPMRGAGMTDFSFDRRTGILGVDGSGSLRQYSCLDLEMKPEDGRLSDAAEKEKIAFACLNDKTYILVKENGELITNLTDCAADFFSWQTAKERIRLSDCAAVSESDRKQERDAESEIPFSAAAVSISDQLIGFETPDSRAGVWDRERQKLLWMEE